MAKLQQVLNGGPHAILSIEALSPAPYSQPERLTLAAQALGHTFL